MDDSLFQRYASVLTDRVPPSVRDPRLLIAQDGRLKVYYAPFEHVNTAARIVLVGITPGPTQMVNANSAARQALLRGLGTDEAIMRAKLTASFSGEPMRSNLVGELNHWGVSQWLGLDNAARLFGDHAHLVQSTSLLRYPTFVADEDYRGSPDMTRNVFLKSFLYEHFVNEVAELPNALFFSLGPKVQRVLEQLVQESRVTADRVVTGLLHPSPNNTYRIKYLLGDRREPVPHMTNPATYDAGRAKFREMLALGCSL